jgi:hypothetical protein
MVLVLQRGARGNIFDQLRRRQTGVDYRQPTCARSHARCNHRSVRCLHKSSADAVARASEGLWPAGARGSTPQNFRRQAGSSTEMAGQSLPPYLLAAGLEQASNKGNCRRTSASTTPRQNYAGVFSRGEFRAPRRGASVLKGTPARKLPHKLRARRCIGSRKVFTIATSIRQGAADWRWVGRR